MNKTQRNYMAAKAAFQALEAGMVEKEREFLKEEGQTETRIYMVEDEADFTRLSEEFASLTKDAWNRLVAAEETLKTAEESLVEYALSIAPAKIRDTLRYGCRKAMVRDQLIDIALKLDTRTAPRGGLR
jgi:Tfp pilus assembly protein PilX